jgi:GT2 family glycosyltransferase
MYDAVNKGVALARGEILGYLNSDDAYLPWAVESIVAAFAARPAVDVLYGDAIRIDETKQTQELRLLPPFDRASLAHFGSLIQPAVFWRRRVMERVGGFDDRFQFVADLDYWLRAASSGGIDHIDEVLAVDRVHEAALSTVRREEMALEELAMRHRHGIDIETDKGRAGRTSAIRRDKAWARWLWIRFLRASLATGPSRRWNRFLTDGAVHVPFVRIVFGQLPRIGYRLLRTSVSSSVAAAILDPER